MKTVGVAAALCLVGFPALAQVTFTCQITSGGTGYEIDANNPGPGDKNCTASCTVTQASGVTRTGTGTSVVQSGWNGFFFGEGPLPDAPLSNPTMGNTSCN